MALTFKGGRGPESLSIKQAAGFCCSWMVRGVGRGHGAKSAHGTPDKCSVKDVIYLHFGIVWKLIRVFHLWRLQWFLII